MDLQGDGMIEQLREAYKAEKSVATALEWSTDSKGRSGELKCFAPLWIDGAIRLGMRFDMKSPKEQPHGRPFFGLTALLFANISGERIHLSRIEFDPENPFKPHRNRPNNFDAPPMVRGPHYHPFDQNCALGAEALGLGLDLPLAFPLETEPANFNEALELIRQEFIIPGLWLEEPPCSILLV